MKTGKVFKAFGVVVLISVAVAGVVFIISGGGKVSGWLLIMLALIGWAAYFNFSKSRKFHDRFDDLSK